MDVEKKLKVFNVAKELFERFGFKKTTVDEIAAGSGISKRTLYEMFESKEQILSELVMYEALLIRKMIQKELKEMNDPLAQMENFLKMAGDYFKSNPFLCKVLSDDNHMYAPFLRNEIQVIEEGIEGFFFSILKEGIKQGVFRKMDARGSANCMFVLFRSFTYTQTLKPNKAWYQFVRNAIVKDDSLA